MRSNFTPEETDGILAKHYPWARKKPKCVVCGIEIDEDQGRYCDACFEYDGEDQ